MPKLITVVRRGYGFVDLKQDAFAGLTVAIIALPLAMALAIASGATPEKGLVTAIVAGFLISALGGSRYQIGGPTGAFVVVVSAVIARHGYDGLIIATFMAGIMLLVAGWAQLGTWVKYIPQPVITGFTAGIALIIASSQVGDFLGLQIAAVPADFMSKWVAYIRHLQTFDMAAVGVAVGTFGLLIVMRRWLPKWPAFLFAVVVAASIVWYFKITVTTIGVRFGMIPHTLPVPHWPDLHWQHIQALIPSAFTIAFLAGVESLLSAVVADGMTGKRHKSNCELVAQGVANLGSALFAGLPATGAIARTATNIRSGARSPIAGMLHAVFLLLFMWVLAPLIQFIPLPSLAAILMLVAWNMSEVKRFRHLMSAPIGDRVVLLTTFGLTVWVDLTVAIEVGVVLAAVLFMHRMAEAAKIQNHAPLLVEDEDDMDMTHGAVERSIQRQALPAEVELFELRGPFFFGVANTLMDVITRIGKRPKVFLLLLREVPLIDATGVSAFKDFTEYCQQHKIVQVLIALQPSVQATLEQMALLPAEHIVLAADFKTALVVAQQHLQTFAVIDPAEEN